MASCCFDDILMFQGENFNDVISRILAEIWKWKTSNWKPALNIGDEFNLHSVKFKRKTRQISLIPTIHLLTCLSLKRITNVLVWPFK